MIASAALAKRALSMFGRVFPRCGMISQAIAYNLFLAFFPTLLIAVGFATSPIGIRTSLYDLIADFTRLLPPGSGQLVSEFLIRRGPQAWKWALVGWTGTLLGFVSSVALHAQQRRWRRLRFRRRAVIIHTISTCHARRHSRHSRRLLAG